MNNKKKPEIKATFLGTGTSQGVPVIACNCDVCQSSDFHDKRLRSSLLINIGNKNIVIDAGPDFRQQMLREKVQALRAILITHEHADHILGLDDIRDYNCVQKNNMEIYAEKRVQEAIKRIFAYVFAEFKYPGVPKMQLKDVTDTPFFIDETKIIPIRCLHYKLPVYGYRIGNLTYITDTNFIPDEELEKAKGSRTLIINALRREKHLSHFNLDEALAVIAKIKPQKAYLTHIGHQFGRYANIEKELPQNVFMAYDGLTLTV